MKKESYFLTKICTLVCMFFLACILACIVFNLWIAAHPHVIDWLDKNLDSIVDALIVAMFAAIQYLIAAYAGGWLLEACVHAQLSPSRRLATMLGANSCEAAGVLFGVIVYEMARSLMGMGGVDFPGTRFTVCLAVFQLVLAIAGWNAGSETNASIQAEILKE